MAEKDHQIQANTDVESARVQDHHPDDDDHEIRHKRHMRRLGCLTALMMLQTAITLAFCLTVMHVKAPKFQLRSIEIKEEDSPSNGTAFSTRIVAELAIKNTNFGPLKFDRSSLSMAYEGFKVGEAFIPDGEAKARSTKGIEVTLDVASNNVSNHSNLARDLKSGFLSLTGYGRLDGEVHLMKVFKKKKSPQMNCTVEIDLEKRVIQEWKCMQLKAQGPLLGF